MAGFDTTNVAAEVGQNQPNMLQTFGSFANIQNALNQNRLFQSQQAAGQAFQGAIGPDGTFNQPALLNNLARDPRAAMAALQTANAGQVLSSNTASLASQQKALADKAWASVPSRDANGNPTPNATSRRYALINQLAATGAISQDLAKNYAGGNIVGAGPQSATITSDELAQSAALQDGGAGVMMAQVGTPGTVQTGPTVEPTTTMIGDNGVATVAPVAGAAPVATMKLSPAEAAQPVQTLVDGRPATVPLGSVRTATGGALAPGAAAGLVGPGGSIPSGYTPQEQAAGAAAGAQTGTQSGGAFASLQTNLIPAQNQITQLKELRALLTQPETATGPASNYTAQIGAMAREFGIPVPAFQANAPAIEVFRKIATQIAQQQFQTIGGTGTDSKLASAAHTSPDNLLSAKGNAEIIPLLQGNARAQVVMASLGQQWLDQHNQDARTYPQFQAWFQKHYNPLVFQSAYMTPSQLSPILANMTKAERAQYDADRAYAVKNQFIPP